MSEMEMNNQRAQLFPKASPNGWIAAFLLAFVSTAGLFYVNIMAAIVDGLTSGLNLNDQQAGAIGSANIYGAAFGALLVVPLLKKFPWRPMAITCLILLIALDLFSIPITDYNTLLYTRLVHGIVGGFLVGVGFGVVARTANPDRTFGTLLFVQFGLGGLGVMFLPQLVPVYGTQALFLALAAFSIVTLLMVPFLDRYPVKDVQADEKKSARIELRPLALTLLAIFVFQAANMALLAYIIRLGLDFGLDRAYASTALGLSTWVALIGPLVVMFLGIKIGRFWPLACGMALTLAGMWLFHLSAQPWAYLVANCTTGITWGLVIAYLLGMTSEFDAAGRMSAMGGFISKLGLASGPLVAGQMLANGAGFGALINFAIIALAVSTFIMLAPALALDRKSKLSPTSTSP